MRYCSAQALAALGVAAQDVAQTALGVGAAPSACRSRIGLVLGTAEDAINHQEVVDCPDKIVIALTRPSALAGPAGGGYYCPVLHRLFLCNGLYTATAVHQRHECLGASGLQARVSPCWMESVDVEVSVHAQLPRKRRTIQSAPPRLDRTCLSGSGSAPKGRPA